MSGVRSDSAPDGPTADQWRSAASALREHARKWEALAGEPICGVISNSGPNGEPLACAYAASHTGTHSWASLPTFVAVVGASDRKTQ